jgi:hypothetical protein
MSLEKWYDSIGTQDGVLSVADPKQFKYSAGIVICSIVNLRKDKPDELCKFCQNFQKDQNLSDEEAESLFKDAKTFHTNLDKHIAMIKAELGHSDHKQLEFMHILNRFIIQDNCDDSDYVVFETVKQKLFA